jgi:hypothetical protein
MRFYLEEFFNSPVGRYICFALFACAALYAAFVFRDMSTSYGPNADAAIAAAQFIESDTYDMAALITGKLGIADVSNSTRPMQYVLICAESGDAAAETAIEAARKSVIKQLEGHSGMAFVMLREAMDDGRPHIRFDLMPGAYYPFKVFSTKLQDHLDCTSEMHEVARVAPAVIFGPARQF